MKHFFFIIITAHLFFFEVLRLFITLTGGFGLEEMHWCILFRLVI